MDRQAIAIPHFVLKYTTRGKKCTTIEISRAEKILATALLSPKKGFDIGLYVADEVL